VSLLYEASRVPAVAAFPLVARRLLDMESRHGPLKTDYLAICVMGIAAFSAAAIFVVQVRCRGGAVGGTPDEDWMPPQSQ
jgi:hypothetical protein